jgi:hypothetical protein
LRQKAIASAGAAVAAISGPAVEALSTATVRISTSARGGADTAVGDPVMRCMDSLALGIPWLVPGSVVLV